MMKRTLVVRNLRCMHLLGRFRGSEDTHDAIDIEDCDGRRKDLPLPIWGKRGLSIAGQIAAHDYVDRTCLCEPRANRRPISAAVPHRNPASRSP